MPSPLRPLAKAIRDGFFRGVGDGLEQMWSHVLKEPLSGKLARALRHATQMKLSASAVVFRVQLTYRNAVPAHLPQIALRSQVL